MTTATLDRPHGGFTESFARAADFTGTGRLLRLYLRRDRIVLPLWVLLFSAPLGSVYFSSVKNLYSSPADLQNFAHTILSSPAQLALYGPIYNTSLGAAGAWKPGAFYTLIGIATILTVIRHTRAEEETGREELLASTRMGRFAALTATLLLTCAACVAVGIVATLSIASSGVPFDGSLAFGAALAASGIVFAAVAAVAAQLSASARLARGIALAVLAVTFTLRAIGDARAGDGPADILTWLSPQGWSLQVRPFAGDRWWVLLLHVVTTVVLIAVAYTLLRRRDLGAGLIADRPGPPAGSALLSGPFGLAWRLQRGTLVAWTVGLALYGLIIGSVVHGIGDEIGSSQTVRDIIARLGGSQAVEQAFLNTAFSMVGLGAAAFSISAALRMYAEESDDRAETVLTGAVGRIRWAASHLIFAFGGPVVALFVSGVIGGLAYGIAASDMGAKFPEALGAAMIQIPAVWVFTAITVLLFGLLPRWTPVAWGVFTAGVAIYLLGSISGMPQWVLDLNPYGHLPKLPAEGFRAVPVIVLLVLAAVITAVGLVGWRRRDLR
ncbi:ABC transporter permease [Nocardia violaceofusca]|uniref:ABC transporter permease n=1 Tax=Nocardia violaceofusca TaxID=941182 RepID=UPI0009FDFF16|nr:ABC transporter permease [Nocardia violaceofusca]